MKRMVAYLFEQKPEHRTILEKIVVYKKYLFHINLKCVFVQRDNAMAGSTVCLYTEIALGRSYPG